MNHNQRLMPPGAKRILHFFVLLAAVLSSPKAPATLLPEYYFAPLPKVPTRGYLQIFGAPELRFQEHVVVLERPVDKPDTAMAKKDNPAATPPTAPHQDIVMAAPEHSANTEVTVEEKPAQKIKAGTTQRILPDNTRPIAHPEDFLPYFRFPAAIGRPGSLEVAVPVPANAPAGAPLPESSATYSQSPK